MQKVELSRSTITFTAFFLISLWFIFKIRYVLLLLFIAIILMSALSPLVDKLEKLKIPRGLAILLLYLLIWTVISFGIASLVPALVEQSTKFISSLPPVIEQVSRGTFDTSAFTPQLINLPERALKLVLGVFNNVVMLFTLMVLVYYLIMERKNLKKYLVFLFGDGNREKNAEKFIDKIEHKLGGWMRGQLALMIIVGLMSYIGLSFLGVEFAIPLAFLAGLLEIIINVGPTLAMIPAVLIAWSSSFVLALAVLALYFVIQQLENTIIVPKVMQKAVGLSPLIIIISLLTGFRLAGAAGAILAVPSILVLEIIFQEIYGRKSSN